MHQRILQGILVILLLAGVIYVWHGPSQKQQTAALATSIETASTSGLSWLVKNMSSKGLFTYLFDPVVGSTSTNNNELRQLMASRTLAAASASDESLLVAHQKNLDFIFAHWYHTDGVRGYILYEDKSKLGANAMLLRTLVYSPRFDAYRTEATQTAKGITSLIQADGSFAPWFKEPTYSYDADYLLTFYSGEALLALAEYYIRTNDRSVLEPINRAVAFYLDAYVTDLDQNYYPAYVPWHTMAYATLYKHTKEQRYADAIFTLNDKLLELLDTSETVGQFYNPQTPQYGTPHSSSDAVYLEGLAHAYEIAVLTQNTERAHAYQEAILIAAQHLLSLQYTNPIMVYAAEPSTYIGGIRIGSDRPSIRVDTTQHAVDAFQKLLEVL